MDSWWAADGLEMCERISAPLSTRGVVNSAGRLAPWVRFEFPEVATWVQMLGGADRLVVEVGGWPWVMPLRLRREGGDGNPAVMHTDARLWVPRVRSGELFSADEVLDALDTLSRFRHAPPGLALEAFRGPALLQSLL